MPSASIFEDSSPALNGSIARSRSRYKGARPHKVFMPFQSSSKSSAEQSQRLQEKALQIRGRQPTIPDQTELIDQSVTVKRHESRRISDYNTSRPGAIVQPRSVREIQSTNHFPKDKAIDGSHLRPEDLDMDTYHASQELPRQNPKVQDAHLQSIQLGEQPALSRPSALTKKSFTQRISGSTKGHLRSKSREKLKKTISGPVAIEPPQSITTPAFDAPISAVNAGERRVTVSHDQSIFSLPVTPSTTPLDILRLAGEHLAKIFDPRTVIVVESYRPLGLERPLRKYEHVRDVLNSWDNDTQNTLLITSSPAGFENEDLELGSVSRFQPGNTSVSIHYSQRPSQWDKRIVSLRSDGQIVVAKKAGGETTNICHLSDFDIYIPTARQLSRKIRPPRKLCFTVKSQQKSSMFMSTVNFVHFFSTSDKALAASWYKAVQEWRSWYLVHVLGKGQDLKSPTKASVSAITGPSADSHLKMSPPGKLATKPESQNIEVIRKNISQRLPIRNRGAPPMSFPKRLNTEEETLTRTTRQNSAPTLQTSPRREPEPEPFAAASLLGRNYTQRQKAQQSRETNQNVADLATPMPTTTDQSHGLKRASSQRQKPKPLVDLTPQYREPPQHVRKGRGVVPEQLPLGGLVEIATSPEAVVEIPPATTWQRPTTSGRDHSNGPEIQRARTVRRDYSTGPTSSARQASTSSEKGEALFTSGLLAGEGRGQGGMQTGKGVMTGDRSARTPMLDVVEPSNYASGSLLEHAERHDIRKKHVVEREKATEMDATVG